MEQTWRKSLLNNIISSLQVCEEKSHHPLEFLEWFWELFVSPGHHFPIELENLSPWLSCHHLNSLLLLYYYTLQLQQVWIRHTYTILSFLKENCLLIIYQLFTCPPIRYNLRYLSRWHVSSINRGFVSKIIKIRWKNHFLGSLYNCKSDKLQMFWYHLQREVYTCI